MLKNMLTYSFSSKDISFWICPCTLLLKQTALLCLLLFTQISFAQTDSVKKDSLKTGGFSKKKPEILSEPTMTPPATSIIKDTTKKSFSKKDTTSQTKIASDTTQNDSILKWKTLAKKTLQFLDREIYPDDLRKLLKSRHDSFPDPSIAYKRAIVFPGWGQMYNRRYWKLPIVYGVMAVPVYFAYNYNKQYQDLRKAYTYSIDNDPSTLPGSIKYEYGLSTAEGLRTSREDAHRQRDNFIMYSAIVYALQVVEAFVDAHLQSFDVSNDLSFKVQPTFLPAANAFGGQGQLRSGIGLSLRF
jgi:hypothetical protein